LFDCAAHWHDLKRTRATTGFTWIGDPMQVSLMQLAEAAGHYDVLPRVDEIPFEPERKRLVTVHQGSEGPIMFVTGAPEELLIRAGRIDRDGNVTHGLRSSVD
jgi:magnesium-transporting ATPase (P-type)